MISSARNALNWGNGGKLMPFRVSSVGGFGAERARQSASCALHVRPAQKGAVGAHSCLTDTCPTRPSNELRGHTRSQSAIYEWILSRVEIGGVAHVCASPFGLHSSSSPCLQKRKRPSSHSLSCRMSANEICTEPDIIDHANGTGLAALDDCCSF